MAESMLFATLDPTTRKVKLPGFIQDAPAVLAHGYRRVHPEIADNI
jgi:50S ribosomal subunit-associated GTPase HflX